MDGINGGSRTRSMPTWSRRVHLRLAALLAGALILTAACSDRDVKVVAPQVLVVTAAWNSTDSPAERKAFMTILDKFTDRTGIVVTYREPEHAVDFATDLPKWLGTTDANRPDVALLPQPWLLRSLKNCHQLQPLSEATKSVIQQNYSPKWQDLGKVSGDDDNTYGLVFKAGNKSAIWYNTRMMQASGVSVPASWTWDEFMATTMAASTGLGFPALAIGARGTDGWVLTDWFENVYLRVAGAKRYERLADLDVEGWQDGTVVAALTHLAELWRHPEIIGSPRSTLRSQAFDRVFGGTVRSALLAGDFVPEINNQPSAEFAQFPSIDLSGPAVIAGTDIAAVTSNDQQELADGLVRFLASADAAAVLADAGFVTPNTGIDDSKYTSPVVRKAREDMLDKSTLVEFDLSDELPTQFAGTPGTGLQEALGSLMDSPTAVGAANRTASSLASQIETLKPAGCI